MVKDEHLDKDIFRLLESGVYLSYAEKFLDPSQIDEVDIKPGRTPFESSWSGELSG